MLERLKNPRSFKIVNDDADDDDNINNNNNDDIEDDELIEMEDLSVFEGIRESIYGNENSKNKHQMLDMNGFSGINNIAFCRITRCIK